MSGFIVSTGLCTNNGENKLEIDKIMKLKIKNLSIQVIPLFNDKNINTLRRTLGTFFQMIIHPAILSPTFSHIAIQLNMENDEDIIIMEYGQYITDIDKSIKKSPFGSCNNIGSKSINNPRTDKNDNYYWYINGDGARITKVDNKIFLNNSPKNETKEFISNKVSTIIAAQHYGMSLEEFYEEDFKSNITESFKSIDCDVENKITLEELCEYFKGEEWKASNYKVTHHNCQTFGAEIIKILKAKRINEEDKIRLNETTILPNCIISNLWDNEKLSVRNTIGRIPIIGLLYDLYLKFSN